MRERKVFYIDDTPSMPGFYIIKINHSEFNLGPTVGSYNLIMGRILNISYANFLRLCRDNFNARIVGKNSYYPVAYFPSALDAKPICDLLNSIANIIIWNNEHPDYEQHKKEIDELRKNRK